MDAPAGNGLLRRCAIPALIAVATVAAFAPALGGSFLNWDDDQNFLTNPAYRGLGPNQLRWMWTTFLMGHYHPLTWMTLGLDALIWGMDPFGYHLTSLLLHAVGAVLLYFVLLSLLRLAGRPKARWAAAAGALLHGLHPLRVESVAWITERRDVLCGVFFLLSLLAYLKRVEEERAGRPSARWLALSLAAFAASLLSKALGIMLPALLLILDVHPLGRFTPGRRLRVLGEKALFGLLSLADGILMLTAMRHIQAVRSAESYNILERAAQAAYGLCFYLLKTVWPSGLSPVYRIDSPLHPGDAKYVLSILAVAAGTALLIAFRRRCPGLLAAWLGMVALLLPVLGVAVSGYQIAADRYTYLALMPAAALAAWALDLRAPTAPRAAVAATAGLLLVLSALTFHQCRIWKDSFALWNRALEVDPGNAMAYLNRGSLKQDGGAVDAAIEDYTRSLELNPADSRSPYDTVIRVRTLVNRGALRRQKGDLAGALADVEEAIRVEPSGGNAYTVRASVRRARGDLDGAEADLDRAVALSPQSVEAVNNRGTLRLQRGRTKEALEDYDRALALQPDNALVLVARGQTRLVLGNGPGAAADLERALQLSPPGWALRRDVEALLQRARGTR
jgi:tetratricopeptide (TPR) repeat protein